MSDNKKDQLSIHDSHHNLESGNQHGPKRPDSMRRRSLIKASVAAVPTVLTLRSGLVSAASMDCRHKDAAVTDVPEVISATDHDNWLRAEAYEYSDGIGLAAFGAHPREKDEFTRFIELKNAYDLAAPDSGVPLFCDLSKDEQNAKIVEWELGSVIQRHEGTFLHVTNTDKWYVYNNTSMRYDPIQGAEGKHFIFCNLATATETQSLVLVYVSFDDNGHIVISDIRHYPDAAEGNQQITESCACSIDPMFQMPDG
jgi:hypothetical protein